jgi:hypothetical protein
LGGLVDKSLVAVVDGPTGERRFRLLEPVRQFAAQLLQATGEQDDAARCHRDHLLTLLTRLAGQLNVTPDSRAYESLAAELDNVRAAVEHSLRASRPEAALQLTTAYRPGWHDLGLLDEQLDLLDRGLRAADPAHLSLDLLAAALSHASHAASMLCRFDEAAAFVEQLGELRVQHPDIPKLRGDWASALAGLTASRAGGDAVQAKRLYQEAQQVYEACGSSLRAGLTAIAIAGYAVLWDCADDPDVALAIRDGARLAQTTGAPYLPAQIRILEGILRVMGGAREAYPSCLDAFTELDLLEHERIADGMANIGVLVAAELVGDYPTAATHALRWVRFCRRSGPTNWLTCGPRAAARLSARAGYPAEALRLWGGAEHVEAVTGLQYLPLMERLDRPLLQQCTDAVGPDATRLLAEGASWSVAEANQAAEEALLTLQAANRTRAGAT